MPRVYIPGTPANVDFDVEEDRVTGTLYFGDMELGSETLAITEANEEGLGYYMRRFNLPLNAGRGKLELWVRWAERKIVLVLVTHVGGNREQQEKWIDF